MRIPFFLKSLLPTAGFLLYVANPAHTQVPANNDPADTSGASELSQLDSLFRSLISASQSYDINRPPIHICFITDSGWYRGFIIAGHAEHEVCEVASMGVRNLLRRVGFTDSTIFSFGTGFDIRGIGDTTYNNGLKNLEKTFLTLQNKPPYEVAVSYVPYSTFDSARRRIHENMELARACIGQNDSLQRAVFRYDRPGFPLPVPFYDGDSIARFKLPKTITGTPPDLRGVQPSLIRRVLDTINKALATNAVALKRLAQYDPIAVTGVFRFVPYNASYFNGIKTTDAGQMLVQFDSARLVRETFGTTGNYQTTYYSLSDLRRRCLAGGQPLKGNGGKLIYPCEEASMADSIIKELKRDKSQMITAIRRINNELIEERRQASELLQDSIYTVEDQLSSIDAFLRGWPFRSGDPSTDKLLAGWYDSRASAWKYVLSSHPSYAKTDSLVNAVVPWRQRIAGVFHFPDVFFDVRDKGSYYLVTPYKMLGSGFIQVVDKKSPVTNFYSALEFRSTKF